MARKACKQDGSLLLQDSSKAPTPHHADDRELDERDIEEVGIEKVDTTFQETYAPVLSLIQLNNNMMEGTDLVKIAVAALLGAYILHLLAEEKDGTKVISVAIQDKDKKNLDHAASKSSVLTMLSLERAS